MKNNIYPCFICNQWFETKGAQKAHKCGEVKPEPVKQEDVINDVDLDGSTENTETNENTKLSEDNVDSKEENSEIDREKIISALIANDIIKDKRSATRKTDEELADMLAGS